MGVPKFFRWISERYPCLSELVKEHQIPEFDNLYLDMNGIIHVCSHPNDHDPHFRISEEKICKDVFHYIEILFRMIKPHKLFFMAVDGVAPRAKQNQQRGRRFRTAKDAEVIEKKAKEKGEALPETARFDSNCITPGTVFMERLQEELKYYVSHKISTDTNWQKCKVILSGHETPGEGEHKIMDYIRYMKSQPDYDSDTRHCLYGLDADLIMLGLCSHEPRFALLREEVKFGKGNHDKRISTAEETTFYLLHLSLMREYLEMEFSRLKGKLPFKFNLESIIDDWVLMGFLVGNDFIPPLPDMHINEGALPLLYNVYIEVLPTLGGYINEQGFLNLSRFQKYMEKLSEFDINQFRENYADLVYFNAKTGRRPGGKVRHSYKNDAKYQEMMDDDDFSVELPEPVNEKPKSRELESLIKSTNDMCIESSDDEFESADGSDSEGSEKLMLMEFRQHKNDYYMNKLEYEQVTPEVMREQAECYVRAIQWNLHYYYNGVCSWSWFYPHHYAPYISDIKEFDSLELNYDMGTPFLPFQQLLAVLPSASKTLLPEAFQHLMESEDSPIIDYYPLEFSTDMNGKKQEWEALVLIPFIDEGILLSAMEACYSQMTPDEQKRNSHGPMSVFYYSPDDLGEYKATHYNLAFTPNHAMLQMVHREEIFVERSNLVKGLCPNVDLDVYFPGFPTFKHIPFTSNFNKKKVQVFEFSSRGENCIVNISKRDREDLEELAVTLLNKNIYVSWPHLVQAKVISVSNNEVCYTLPETDNDSGKVANGDVDISAEQATKFVTHTLSKPDIKTWNQERTSIAEVYLKRRGIDVGETTILLRACICVGHRYKFKPDEDVELVKQWAQVPSSYVLQATVTDLLVNDRTLVKFTSMSEVFPVGTPCFFVPLADGKVAVDGHYGEMGTVIEGSKLRRIKVKFPSFKMPDFTKAKELHQNVNFQYMQGSLASSYLAINAHLLSRITGNIFVTPDQNMSDSGAGRKVNIALHLKYSSKNEEIPGYTKRDPNGTSWLYSKKTVELVDAYMTAFPDLIDYLSSHPSSDELIASEVFSNPERLNEITEWLKEQDYAQLSPQACGSEQLEVNVIQEIEEAVKMSTIAFSKNPKFIKLQVKPHLLHTPDLSNGTLLPDPTATFRLFDRVINCRRNYSVPLGLKGVIIGICKAGKDALLYEVVFDQAFPGGLTLNCSEKCGYRMPPYALLNMSHGLRVERGEELEVKAPTPYSAPKTHAQPMSVNSSPRFQPPVPNARIFTVLGGSVPSPPPKTSNSQKTATNKQVASQKQEPWRTKQTFENSSQSTQAGRNKKPDPVPEKTYSILTRAKEPSAMPPATPASTTDFQALWTDYEKQQSPQPEPKDASSALREMLRIPSGKGAINNQQSPRKAVVEAAPEPAVQKKWDPTVQQMFAHAARTAEVPTTRAAEVPTTRTAEVPTTRTAEVPTARTAEVPTSEESTKPTDGACAVLLGLFQAQSLGTPRYCYTTDYTTKAYQAIVTLPDNRTFRGRFDPSKEKASELAAVKALEVLKKETLFVPPTPPQQWCAVPVLPPMSQVPFANQMATSKSQPSNHKASIQSISSNKLALVPARQPSPAPSLVQQVPFMPQFAQTPHAPGNRQLAQLAQTVQQRPYLVQQPSFMPQFPQIQKVPIQPQAVVPMPFMQQNQKTLVPSQILAQQQSTQQFLQNQVTIPRQQVTPQLQPNVIQQFPQNQKTIVQVTVTATTSAPSLQQYAHHQQTAVPQPHMKPQFPQQPAQLTYMQPTPPTQTPHAQQQVSAQASFMFPRTPLTPQQAQFLLSNQQQPPFMSPSQQPSQFMPFAQPSPMQHVHHMLSQGGFAGPNQSFVQQPYSPLQIRMQQPHNPQQQTSIPSSERVVDGPPAPQITGSRIKICANFPGTKKKKK